MGQFKNWLVFVIEYVQPVTEKYFCNFGTHSSCVVIIMKFRTYEKYVCSRLEVVLAI